MTQHPGVSEVPQAGGGEVQVTSPATFEVGEVTSPQAGAGNPFTITDASLETGTASAGAGKNPFAIDATEDPGAGKASLESAKIPATAKTGALQIHLDAKTSHPEMPTEIHVAADSTKATTPVTAVDGVAVSAKTGRKQFSLDAKTKAHEIPLDVHLDVNHEYSKTPVTVEEEIPAGGKKASDGLGKKEAKGAKAGTGLEEKESKEEIGEKGEKGEKGDKGERTDDAERKAMRERAEDELDFRFRDGKGKTELERTRSHLEKETFLDGEGREITKREALDRMTGDLRSSLTRLREDRPEITDEKIDAIVGEAERALLAQEAESQSRGIGNHGIPHLFSVYERMSTAAGDDVLEQAAEQVRASDSTSRATADDMRAALVLAAAYHDEGYLSAAARQGPGRDGLHGVDSAIAFEHLHAENLRGAVDDAVLADVREAIAEHNGIPDPQRAMEKAGLDPEDNPTRMAVLEQMRESGTGNMDPNDNFVRSALLLSDRLGLDANEKMPDVLRSEERLGAVFREYQKMAEAGGEADPEQLKADLAAMIETDGALTAQQKAHYQSALRDIDPGSGRFDMPMGGVAIRSDALRFRRVTDRSGESHLEAEVDISHRVGDLDYEAAFGNHSAEIAAMRTGKAGDDGKTPVEAKQLAKALEDYGITRESMSEVHGGDLPPSAWLEKTGEGTYTVQTEPVGDGRGPYSGIPGLEHVTVRVSEMTAADEVREPEYMKKAMGKASETVMPDVEAHMDRADAADALRMERNEAIREAKSAQQAMERFNGSPVTRESIIDLCTNAYSDANRAEVDGILRELTASDEVPPEKLEELAARCRKLELPRAPEGDMRTGEEE